ncbi:MAG: FAD-binding oxidoreductase [Armatimonadaceae bacterium]
MVDIAALTAIVGVENVRTDAETLARMVPAWSVPVLKQRQAGEGATAAAVVYPGSAAETAAMVAWARQSGTPLYPVGGLSTTVEAVKPAPTGVALDLSRLTGLTVDEESLQATVGTGWRWNELETTLNEQQYTLGQVPRSAKLLTVGGAIATNAVGAFSGRYGRVGERVAALEVVTGTGEVLNLHRAASFDLLNLFVGSEGQLGILTAATLELRVQPEVQAWMAFTFRNLDDALDAARLIYRTDSRPTLVRVFDAEAAAPYSPGARALLLAMVEGDELAQTGMYQLAHAVCQTVGGAGVSSFVGDSWYGRWQETDFLSANAHPEGIAAVLAVGAEWAQIKAVERAVRDALTPHISRIAAELCHPTPHGAAWEFTIEAKAQSGDPEAAAAKYADLVAQTAEAVQRAGGRIAHHYGVGRTWQAALTAERGEAQMALWKSLKAAFDPDDIFYFGVFA